MKTILAACTLVGAASIACAADYGDIGVAELKAVMAAKRVVLVDANGEESYREGHIPGAVLFEGRESLAKLLPTDRGMLVVAYCGGAACSAYRAAAKAAEALGFSNVKHLGVGLRGWKAAGEATERAK